MRRVQAGIGSKRLWVIDRGGDRSVLWNAWLKEDFDVLVRVTKQRHWLRGRFKGDVQKLAKQVPTKYRGTLRKGSDKDICFGLTRRSIRIGLELDHRPSRQAHADSFIQQPADARKATGGMSYSQLSGPLGL